MTTEQVQQIPRLPESVNFPQNEADILALWTKLDVFQTCLKQSKNKPKYSFYDGPPFATGLPHYGHILAGTIKDTVTRYAHQQGFHVARRFGWDCHGLPIEFEIDKALGIKGPEDVMRMGIRAYNDECRKIVTRYVNEWEVIMGRIGRWIDFKNDYKTMYPWFMESVWWVFSQLYEKGMVYQGNKVMPYSTACSTPLSNFESGQNYKDVVDPAVTVTLPLLGDSDGCCLLIWTTTPWTLPSNLAACVHPTLEYARVKQLSTGKYYVVMAARIDAVFKPGDYEIHMKFPGANLKGLEYTPIFDYFVDVMKSQGAYRVVVDEYVTSESGTGIVHQAAYFGEDDYRVCLANDIITKDQDPICPIDASGRLTAPVRHFEGQYIKDADKNIIAHLKNAGRLFHHAQVKHSYPYCWRSDTPLIYRAVPSWFIRVEHMTTQLLSANSASYWVPDFVKEKRFGNWLRDARDWAVSRNRYWGTPIPIWASGDEFRCVGSIAELERLTGKKITDLHRENIDDLEIPSQIPGNPPLRRISEVFDCWFESGSMPYAQQHYPFENKREFDDVFPADFIAEGIDQTRGWFYTLLVISTALYGRAPFKNLIANGLVLAGDGQKMSKRKKNYPDPMVVVGKYGADALRLYLISSPVVRAENLRFKEEGVRDIIKDVFLPWYNAFRFLMQNLESYVDTYKVGFHYCEADLCTENIMDKWILSFTQSLLDYVRTEMALYHLYNVVPRLTKYIDYLTNWYVRMNRKRFKGAAGQADCRQALLTLFNVLYAIIRMMAPFAPFLAEFMYQYIKTLTEQSPPPDSVHYLMLPEPNLAQIDTGIERSVSRLQTVIDLSRVLRDRNTLPVKIPLPEVVVIHQDAAYLDDIIALRHYVLSELNVRELTTTVDKSRYGVTMRAEPDFKTLGVRLKNDFKAVTHAIKALTDSEINATVKRGYVEVCGHRIALNELRLIFKADTVKTDGQYHVESDGDVLVLLNAKPDDRMIDEGTAREVINRVQKLRKKAKLVPTDKIIIRCETDGDVKRVCEDFHEFIETTLRAPFFLGPPVPKTETVILGETQNLKESVITVRLCAVRTLKAAPICFWANVELLEDISPQYCDGSRKGTILLEKYQSGVGLLSYDELHQYIGALFGVSREFNLYFGDGVLVTLENYKISNGRVIYVTSKSQLAEGNFELSASDPFCKFYNDEKSLTTWLLENPIGVPT